MNISFEKSVICPALIGREPHLALVERLIDEVRDGAGKTLLIAGEAGLGKSRLATAIKERLAAETWSVLQGYAFETERALPYAPLIDLLRAYALGRSSAELAQAFGAAAAELAGLLPELAYSVPALPDRAAPEKHRLFHAVAQFCVRLAESGPLLLLVEDLHWSDEASLELLLYLARHLTAQPVLLLFTYRSDETGAGLTHFLARLDRQRLANEIILSPLGREQVNQMLQAIFDQPRPMRIEFLEMIYRLTDGNPFFIEEVLKAMLMAGDIFYDNGMWDRKPLPELRIPRSVQAAVRQRSQQLSAEAKQVLTLAAVVGRQVDFCLLQALTEHQEGQLLARLKELIEAQLMVEESAERFAFRHALSRVAVYATLLARERQSLHRAIGEALLRLADNSHDERYNADLAYHFYEGQRWDEALTYAQQAGDRAARLYAPYAAIEHFDRAIEAAQHLESPGVVASLHYRRGQAYGVVSNFEAARTDYQQALDMARARGEALVEWQALAALGYLWASRNYQRAGDYLRQALALARTLNDETLVARSLNQIGNWQMNQEQPLAARQQHQEALCIFQRQDNQAGIAETLDLLAITSYNCGDLLGGKAHYALAIPLWRQLGDQQGLLHSLTGLGLAAEFELEFDESPVAEAVAWTEQGVQVAHDIGWRSGEVLALICQGLALRAQGDYGRALLSLQEALAIAQEIEHQEWTADTLRAQGALYLDMLALPEARQQLERALALAQEIKSAIWICQSVATLAPVYCLQGDVARARALLDTVCETTAPAQTLQQRLMWGARIELTLAEDRPDEALRLVSHLIDGTANLSSGRVVPRLWYWRGRALAALGRHAEAEPTLRAAQVAAAGQGRLGRIWPLHVALAEVYLAQEKYELAGQELAAARRSIEQVAARFVVEAPVLPHLQRLRDSFLQQALAQLPQLSPPSSPEQSKQQFGGLTAREREVAALIVQGKTNREIAEEMVISERTAERHVANIMGKLGFNSRAQIAAWTVGQGL